MVDGGDSSRVAILGNLVSYGLNYLRAIRAAGGDAVLYYSRFGTPPGEAGDPSIEELSDVERRRIVMWNTLPYEWAGTRSPAVALIRRTATLASRIVLVSRLRRARTIHALGGESPTARISGRPYLVHATGSDLREVVVNHARGLHRTIASGQIYRAFREAAHVLVCIPELLPLAQEVGFSDATYAPMPLELDRYAPREPSAGRGLRVFAAARLEWDYHGTLRRGSSLKGNDRLVRAFAGLLRKCPDARLTLRRLGRDIAATERLARELDIAHAVDWLGPVVRTDLIAAYRDADVIVDQFVGGCLGLASLEAMACARPLITWIDAELYDAVDEDPPPVACARTEPEIEAALGQLSLDSERRRLGAEARGWVERYHDSPKIGAEMLRLSALVA